MKKLESFKILFLAIILATITSCEDDNDLTTNVESNETKNSEVLFLNSDGILEVSSSQALKQLGADYRADNDGQNSFNDRIKELQNQGFNPLNRIMDDENEEETKEYLKRKSNRIQERNARLGIINKTAEEAEINSQDEIISDPFFASLLNENREIIVGDSIYRYTETGLYFTLKRKKDDLDNYINNLDHKKELERIVSQKNSGNTNVIANRTQVADGISHFVPANTSSNENKIALKNAKQASPSYYSPKVIKENLPIAYINVKGSSLWTTIFGIWDGTGYYFPDGKRAYVRFWNQDYFIFSSIGSSVRYQKRVKILGVSFWQKSYAWQVEMGANNIEYTYQYNVPQFNPLAYDNNTIVFTLGENDHYNIHGKKIFKVPSGNPNYIYNASNTSQKVLTIQIYKNIALNVTGGDVNKAINDVAKQFANNLNSFYHSDIKTAIQTDNAVINSMTAVPFSSEVKLRTSGVKWTRNNDNAIVKYYDLNFLLTWNSNMSGVGDYLGGLAGSKPYKNVSADLYGAAYTAWGWGGIRLITY